MASMNTTVNSSAGMGLHDKHEHEPLYGHQLCGQTPSVSMTKGLFEGLALSYRALGRLGAGDDQARGGGGLARMSART